MLLRNCRDNCKSQAQKLIVENTFLNGNNKLLYFFIQMRDVQITEQQLRHLDHYSQ